MDSHWTLRRVVAGDAEQVAAHGHFRGTDGEHRTRYAAWVQPRIVSGSYVGWFAIMGSRVVGGAGANLLDWGPTRANPGGVMARVTNVFTDAAFRRRGIARALIATVLEHCESRGVREFNLGSSEEGRALYCSLGFQAYPAEMRRRVAFR